MSRCPSCSNPDIIHVSYKKFSRRAKRLLLAENVVDLVDILRSVTDRVHTDEWHLQLFKALEEYHEEIAKELQPNAE